VHSQEEFRKMDTNTFLLLPFFCSTTVVQFHLNKIGYSIPDTYQQNFNKFFKRKIEKCQYQNLLTTEFPIFIKPVGNDKKFDGTVFENLDQFKEILSINTLDDTLEIKPGMEFYISSILKFEVEYRLFIGNGHIYASAFQKGNDKIKIDENFVEEIILTCGKEFFAVDIGFIKENSEWAIVEINPPFALDDYEIDLEIYIKYGTDFHKFQVLPLLNP